MSSSAPQPTSAAFELACIQLTVQDDKPANIKNAIEHIERAAARGAQVIALPECWNCPYSNAKFPEYAEEVPEAGTAAAAVQARADKWPSVKALSDAAARLRVHVVGGSLPERRGDKLYNTSTVYSPSGDLIGKYSKIHLFDIDIPGKMTFKESDTLSGGSNLCYFEVNGIRIGIAICYDIRFPELFLIYSQKVNCHCILVPGAFNTTTGPRHWELLQRARAVDNQVYVSAISPARLPGASYQAWGHTSIVSPWGNVVATTDHDQDIVYGVISLEEVEGMRSQIPALFQRRNDLYQVMSTALE